MTSPRSRTRPSSAPSQRSSASIAVPAAALSTARKSLAFGVMCLGFFIAFLDVQIVASSLREIGGRLSASQDEISWVQTSYLVAEIVVIPLSGWLSRVMSTRWLFAASAAGFTVTSLLCGFAWDIQSMIVFRALQGFLGGSMIPTVFTTAFFFCQGKQVVIAAAIIGGLASLAPTLGPVIGGWITQTWSWYWLFYINLVPGVVVTVLVPLLVKIDKPDLSLLRGADYLGIALMAAFLGCLEYVLEEGPRWDWFGDDTIRTCAWISAIAGIGFVARSLTFTRPVVDARPRHPQLLARLLVLLCHWHWHLWHGLSDANLPGPGPRLRCVADRHCPVDRRMLSARCSAGLRDSGEPHRFALADDVRPSLFRRLDMAVHLGDA